MTQFALSVALCINWAIVSGSHIISSVIFTLSMGDLRGVGAD